MRVPPQFPRVHNYHLPPTFFWSCRWLRIFQSYHAVFLFSYIRVQIFLDNIITVFIWILNKIIKKQRDYIIYSLILLQLSTWFYPYLRTKFRVAVYVRNEEFCGRKEWGELFRQKCEYSVINLWKMPLTIGTIMIWY